jgi:hypothetical protein
MEAHLPHVSVEVVTKEKSTTVIRLAGHRMPLLLLHPEAIADLKRVSEAAVLRAKANSEAKLADAISAFLESLNAVTANFDAEAARYSEYLDSKGRENAAAAIQELESEFKAVRQLGA